MTPYPLSTDIQLLSRQLLAEAHGARQLDDLQPLARRVALLQRAALGRFPARFPAFRQSLETPVEAVERVGREGFAHAPAAFGELWAAGELGEDAASRRAWGLADAIHHGHRLLTLGRDRVGGRVVPESTLALHAEALVRDVLVAVAAADEREAQVLAHRARAA